MAKLHVPPENADILFTLEKQNRRPIIVCAALIAGICVIEVVFLFRYFAERMGTLSSVLIWIALCGACMFKLRIPQILLDRGWCGTLMQITYEPVVRTSPAPRGLSYTYEAKLVLKEGTRIILWKIAMPRSNARLHYRVGDRLCRFSGTRYPVYLEPQENGAQICPLCGARLERDLESCFNCSHSRIHPEEIEKN